MRVQTAPVLWLKELPSLDVTSLEGLSTEEKHSILVDVGQICRQLMLDLGVTWKAQPVDDELRRLTITWIKDELEMDVGPVNNRFIMSTDVGVTYTERVYEGLDLDTKLAMVKYVTLAIYLDDLIDKDEDVAAQAESFLIKTVSGERLDSPYLEQYRNVSVNLAIRMADPMAGNMLLHSCTTFIEGCVLEYRNNQTDGIFSSIGDASVEQETDMTARAVAANHGLSVPLPADGDLVGDKAYLAPHLWPTWLREKSGVTETFAITSFRAPGGVTVPTRMWVAALPEMRAIIMHINDVLSFPKELLADDLLSYIAIVTKERRQMGMPGSAPDGGWCLRDSFEEAYGTILSAGSRINRLLRPSSGTRYSAGGHVNSMAELVVMLKSDSLDATQREETVQALCMVLWETHQKGYVAWHFQTPRYRTHEMFKWVEAMIGDEELGPGWLTSHFPLVSRR